MPISETMAKFNERFWQNFVGKTAETAFRTEVKRFTVHFSPQHVQMAAESGKPFSELIALGGYKIQPIPVDKLTPWHRHLLSLPDERLIELVKESVSPAHVQMLDKYPEVAYGLVQAVKGMVIGNG